MLYEIIAELKSIITNKLLDIGMDIKDIDIEEYLSTMPEYEEISRLSRRYGAGLVDMSEYVKYIDEYPDNNELLGVKAYLENYKYGERDQYHN